MNINTIFEMINNDVNISRHTNICSDCDMHMINIDIYHHIENHYKNKYSDVFDENNRNENPIRNENRMYFCPICCICYNSEIDVNHHLSIEHDDYNIVNSRDISPSGEKFIGFAKLLKSNIISYVKKDNASLEYQKENQCCAICMNDWNSFYDYNTIRDKNSIYPVLLSCCKNKICQNCVRECIIAKNNNFICPWCKKTYLIHNNNIQQNNNVIQINVRHPANILQQNTRAQHNTQVEYINNILQQYGTYQRNNNNGIPMRMIYDYDISIQNFHGNSMRMYNFNGNHVRRRNFYDNGITMRDLDEDGVLPSNY